MHSSAQDSSPSDYTTLLSSLENVVMDLNDMENMIEDFDEENASLFFEKINTYISSLMELEKHQGACNVKIPIDALERLDSDTEQNPEIFSRELLQRCRSKSGQLGTRVQGIDLIKGIVAEGWSEGREPGEVKAISGLGEEGLREMGHSKGGAGSGASTGNISGRAHGVMQPGTSGHVPQER